MQQRSAISIIEIMQLMTHDSLLLYKKKRSNAPEVDYVSSEWYRALLCSKHFDRGHMMSGMMQTSISGYLFAFFRKEKIG